MNQSAIPSRLASASRLYVATVLVTVALVVAVLLARRLSGALVVPLDFIPALAAGLLLGVSTWLARRAVLAVAPSPRWSHGLVLATAAATWLLVLALTLSNMSPLAILALWLPMIGVEIAWWQRIGRVGDGESGRVGDNSPPLPLSLSPPHSPSLLQQFTRTRDDASEIISGTARIDFASGEQTAALHLAFCPPLGSDPEIEAEADEAEVEIRVTESRTYGMRLEAKRSRDTAGALSIVVQFEARG